jgi:hypothetical protein
MEYSNFKQIKCHCCQGELYAFEFDDTEIDFENNYMESYQDFGDRQTIELCCKNCRTYYYGCFNCSDEKYSVLKKEIFEENESINDISPDAEYPIVLCQFIRYRVCAEDLNHLPNFVPDPESTGTLEFENLELYYANLDHPNMTQEHGLTGPDGGYCHEWRCNKCGKHYSLTDK